MQEMDESTRDTLVDTQRRKPVRYLTYQGGYSLKGKREKNEDSYYIGGSEALWLVSDGVGGAPYGEVISTVACNYFAHVWGKPESGSLGTKERLTMCLNDTDEYVSKLSDLLGGHGSGATLTAACYVRGVLSVMSIGDSRAYLMRDGELRQMSGNGRKYSDSNMLDQALGYYMNLDPEYISFVPRPADIAVLCTDGVWSTQSLKSIANALLCDVPANEIAELGNPQRMAYRIVEGSDMTDNATAVVVLFTAEQIEATVGN